jgi:thioredoxin 1
VGDSTTVANFNIDEESDVAASFGVRSIPTTAIFRDGDAIQKFVGIQNEHTLLNAIEAASN